MKNVTFIDSYESQSEYVKAMQRGYDYTRHGNEARYLFSREQTEPSVLAELDEELGHFTHYCWVYTGCTMATAREHGVRPKIHGTNDPLNWMKSGSK